MKASSPAVHPTRATAEADEPLVAVVDDLGPATRAAGAPGSEGVSATAGSSGADFAATGISDAMSTSSSSSGGGGTAAPLLLASEADRRRAVEEVVTLAHSQGRAITEMLLEAGGDGDADDDATTCSAAAVTEAEAREALVVRLLVLTAGMSAALVRSSAMAALLPPDSTESPSRPATLAGGQMVARVASSAVHQREFGDAPAHDQLRGPKLTWKRPRPADDEGAATAPEGKRHRPGDDGDDTNGSGASMLHAASAGGIGVVSRSVALATSAPAPDAGGATSAPPDRLRALAAAAQKEMKDAVEALLRSDDIAHHSEALAALPWQLAVDRMPSFPSIGKLALRVGDYPSVPPARLAATVAAAYPVAVSMFDCPVGSHDAAVAVGVPPRLVPLALPQALPQCAALFDSMVATADAIGDFTSMPLAAAIVSDAKRFGLVGVGAGRYVAVDCELTSIANRASAVAALFGEPLYAAAVQLESHRARALAASPPSTLATAHAVTHSTVIVDAERSRAYISTLARRLVDLAVDIVAASGTKLGYGRVVQQFLYVGLSTGVVPLTPTAALLHYMRGVRLQCLVSGDCFTTTPFFLTDGTTIHRLVAAAQAADARRGGADSAGSTAAATGTGATAPAAAVAAPAKARRCFRCGSLDHVVVHCPVKTVKAEKADTTAQAAGAASLQLPPSTASAPTTSAAV